MSVDDRLRTSLTAIQDDVSVDVEHALHRVHRSGRRKRIVRAGADLGGVVALVLLVAMVVPAVRTERVPGFAAGMAGAREYLYDCGGIRARERVSLQPSISGDGTVLAFVTTSPLIDEDADDQADIYICDSKTGTIERIAAQGGTRGAVRDEDDVHGLTVIAPLRFDRPALSQDGRIVAFDSLAQNLTPNDTNGVRDVFAYDRTTRTFHLVSVATDGSSGDGVSRGPSISADGRTIAFESEAGLVPRDTDGDTDVYVRDLRARTTRLVSTPARGGRDDARSWGAMLSADGGAIAFESGAGLTRLDDPARRCGKPPVVGGSAKVGKCPVEGDIYVADLRSGSIELISAGGQFARAMRNDHPSLSGDGRLVAFRSHLSDSVEIRILDRENGMVVVADDSTGQPEVHHPRLSADGSVIAYARGTTLMLLDIDPRTLAREKTGQMPFPANASELTDPVPSADGSVIAAHVQNYGFRGFNRSDVVLLDRETGRPAVVTGSPRWVDNRTVQAAAIVIALAALAAMIFARRAGGGRLARAA